MGINVNADVADYAALIVFGMKKYESRNSNSLKPYIGKRVGIVRTKFGCKAKVVGFVTVGEPEIVSKEEFEDRFDDHLVTLNSPYRCKRGRKKYLYPMLHPQRVEPFEVDSKGIIARKIPDLDSV